MYKIANFKLHTPKMHRFTNKGFNKTNREQILWFGFTLGITSALYENLFS